MTNLYINTESRDTLISFKGIGPVLAGRIIDFRTNTPFGSDEDIISIKGIGIASLEKFKAINNVEILFDFDDDSQLFTPFLATTVVMRNDDAGEGHYEASRPRNHDGLHHGIDILCNEGQEIYAPINGVITKYGYPTDKHLELRYIEITGNNEDDRYRVRIMYSTISNINLLDQKVSRGDFIGFAQSVSTYYKNDRILDHIHFVLFLDGKDTTSDPATFLL